MMEKGGAASRLAYKLYSVLNKQKNTTFPSSETRKVPGGLERANIFRSKH